jgi:hypothetical protein
LPPIDALIGSAGQLAETGGNSAKALMLSLRRIKRMKMGSKGAATANS